MIGKLYLVAISTLILLSALSIQESYAASNITCDDETISTGTFNNVKISEGKYCKIIGDTVILGNVNAKGAEFIQIHGEPQVVIEGSVVASEMQGEISIRDTIIEKNILVKNSVVNIDLSASTVDQNIQIVNNLGFYLIEITNMIIGGNVIIKNNHGDDPRDMDIFSNTIKGNIVITNNNIDDIEVSHTSVDGNINISKNSNFADSSTIDINESMVDGNIVVAKNTQRDIEIVLTSVMGNVIVNSNTLSDDLKILENTVQNNAIFTNNELTGGIHGLTSFDNNNITGEFKIVKNTSVGPFDAIFNQVGTNMKFNKNTFLDANIGETTIGGNLIANNNSMTSDPFQSSLSILFNHLSGGQIKIQHNSADASISINSNDGSQKIIIQKNSAPFGFSIVDNMANDSILVKKNQSLDEQLGLFVCSGNIPELTGNGNIAGAGKLDQCSKL